MVSKKILILIIALCVITAMSVTVTIVLLTGDHKKSPDNTTYYPPVPTDPAAEPIEDDNPSQPTLTNPEGGGAVSLTYSRLVTSSTGDGTAVIMFQNPAKSNQSIVIQLHITDKELVNKIGKTGRTGAEKERIEGAEGYDSERSRMIIAESGLLAPGYKLSSLRLKALPDGTALPAGTYNAVYYILAYDRKTNERSVVSMQIPVTLMIIN